MYRKQLYFTGVILIVVGLFVSTKIKNSVNESSASDVYEVESLNNDETNRGELIENNEQTEKIVVDVKGAVKNTGVYEFNDGKRIYDLIKKAGGFLDDADETKVNLAQKLQDEMIIIVPEKGEINDEVTPLQNANDNTVQINYATKEELETLPGIGPSKAQAIIDYREEQGMFKTNEDLLEISGIGEKTLENIEQYIQIP